MAIQVLAENVVAQIAAGEVVERPASVVKELLENALDAGAENIHVAVNGGGQRMIRISDDGHGIPASEVELAFMRHATSKLETVDDLMRLVTLGFRGEALSSVASVSRVTVTTRHREEKMGTKLRLEGGQLLQRQSVGAPVGTVITVENLFYNTPARLKFLKGENTEKRQIASIVTRYAMAYPHVRFVLEQDGREAFRSNGSGQLADVLVAALGLDSFRNMVEVQGDEDARAEIPVRVFGYTSMPGLNRADRSHITLFVNGRWIHDSTLTFAITQAYHTFLMTGRHPVTVLMIELPTDEVDVNVHPTKAEVRFRDSGIVFEAVQSAVRRAVVELAQTPTVRGGRYAGLSTAPLTFEEETAQRENAFDPVGTGRDLQMDMDLPLQSPGQHARRWNPQERETSYEAGPRGNGTYERQRDDTEIPEGMGAPARPRTLPPMRVIGQVGAAYIVAEGPAGLYLVDQHAAHERILYEQFMMEYALKEPLAQHTLDAQTLQLAASDAQIIEHNLDLLKTIGFRLEPFGQNTFLIRSVPAILADKDPHDVVTGIVDDLESGQEPGQASIEEKIIVRVCKQAAVKSGQVLSSEEMQRLIQQLERCQSPHTCPHGRPTMLHMSREQLAREFGRK